MEEFNLEALLEPHVDELKQFIPSAENSLPEQQLDNGKIDKWEIRTLADAFKPRPPVEYAIAGLFPRPSLSAGYGAPGVLKSMVFASAALHVAAGAPWLGRGVKQSPAMWLDMDNGKRRSDERFEALARYINLDEGTPFFYVSMPTPMFNAGNTRDIEAMANRMLSRGIKFLVIDNLGLISPGADENSDGMIKVMGNLRALTERTGAAIVVIHHQRKSRGNLRDGETLRGHSSIEAALDLALLVEREEQSSVVTIHSTKTRDVQVYPFGAEWHYEHKPGTDELLTAGFIRCGIDDVSSDRALENAIVETVKASTAINQTKLKNDVMELTGIGKNRVLEMIRNLEGKSVLRFTIGPNGGKLYFID